MRYSYHANATAPTEELSAGIGFFFAERLILRITPT